MLEDEIYKIKFIKGRIIKIQSSFIEISLINDNRERTLKITSDEKREAKLKLNLEFKNLFLHQKHILNLETREAFYEIYFSNITKNTFQELNSKYIELINNLYYPFKNFKHFINPHFIKENLLKDQISGKLGIAPESLINELIEIINPEIKITKFPIPKLWNSEGKVLILDDNFIWSKDFQFTDI